MNKAKSIEASFRELPDFFRKDVYSQIFFSVQKSKNLQLIGLRGMGRSLMFRFLESNQENIKKIHKVQNSTLVYLCDLSLISDSSTNAVIKQIFGKLLGLEKLQLMDGGDLVNEIQKYFESMRKDSKKIIIILDALDKLVSYNNPEIFIFLHALYKQNIDYITFIFSLDEEVDMQKAKAEYGEFGRLMMGDVLYLPPLNKKESKWFLNLLISIATDNNISEKEKELILEASGGYSVVIKRLLEAKATGLNLKEIISNPQCLPGLAYCLDLAMEPFQDKLEDLKKIADGQELNNESSLNLFKKYYLVNSDNKSINKVLENYLKESNIKQKSDFVEKIGDIKLSEKLTLSEFKIFNYLANNKGLICTRDLIISEVWGDNATKDVSDHALDQIISRLRKKIKISGNNVYIETIRGRGHRLV